MDNKKKVAAISAVVQYIRTEEEALMAQAQAAPAEKPPAPLPGIGLWGASGRQSMMQLRNLMQLRTFHGSRLR